MSRAYAHDRTAVFRLLQGDHRYALTALQECKTLRASGDTDLMHALALQTCADIERHLHIDKQVIHTHLCDSLSKDMLDRREETECHLRHLLSELRQWTHANDMEGRTRFQVLGHVFCQHVKLEEGLIFHQLSRARLDWLHLHGELLQCRKELSNETIVVGSAAHYL